LQSELELSIKLVAKAKAAIVLSSLAAILACSSSLTPSILHRFEQKWA
jgi:hypothetical protein